MTTSVSGNFRKRDSCHKLFDPICLLRLHLSSPISIAISHATMKFVELRRFIKHGIIGVIGFHFMILLLPILLPILLLFWVVSRVALLLGRLKLQMPVSKPSGLDIVNGKENDISRPYINIAFRFTKRNPDVEKVRRLFQQVVLDQRDEHGKLVFDKFTRVFEKAYGYHLWRDSENFNLSNHIKLFDPNIILSKYQDEESRSRNKGGGKPGIEEEAREDLAGFKWETILKLLLNEVGQAPMTPGLPKWEILILPETENRYTTLFRVHHSITDGLHFVRLMAECLADTPIEVKLPYKFRRGNIIQRTLQNVCSFSFIPYSIYRMINFSDKNPLHGPKLLGKKKFLVSDPFSLNLLKDIKKVAKVTINDIIFSCVSSATEKHFELRNVAVEDITALLAVNLREQNKPLRLRNDFSPNAFKLPTSHSALIKNSSQNKKCDILIDKSTLYDLSKMPSLSRLQIVKNSLYEVKEDPCLLSIMWILITLSSLLPSSIAEYILSTKGTTMDISNIQGPQNGDFIMNEAHAKEVTFWLPDRDPLGLGISFLSYNGVIRAGLTMDEAVMKDEEGEIFLRNLRQEVTNLHSEVQTIIANAEKMESESCAFLPSDIP